MAFDGWKYAYASVKGTSHIKNDKPCQDSCACDVIKTISGDSVLIAVVSDGAGSAKYSDQGSSLACQLIMESISECIKSGVGINEIRSDHIVEWINVFQTEVLIKADCMSVSVREFACTLLVAVVGEKDSIFLQVGDGAIVMSIRDEQGTYENVFWPEQGEYENTTYFATDKNVMDNLRLFKLGSFVDEIAIFTDGLQRLALDYQKRRAHTPFFNSFFVHLRAQSEMLSAKYTESLKAFLNSPQINDRTDDDKTLILATRSKMQ